LKTLIHGGRVIDPSQNIDAPFDVLIQAGKIVELTAPGKFKGQAKKLDAAGCVVAPGFVDLHTHLREPGFEGRETIFTGSRAAVAGGFTSICCMANTDPVNDNYTITGFILGQARQALCKVYPVGASTIGLKGEAIASLLQMKESGVIAYSNDGVPIRNSELQRRIFELARQAGMVVLSHAEDPDMIADGLMHEGPTSTENGLPGIPDAAEEIAVARDILLAKLTRCRLHICHLSTAGALDLVRWAKQKKIPVTCEVTPHHFTLIDEDVREYDTNCKMSPPLRSRADRAALIKGLADGAVDAIATDHAPHGRIHKQIEFDKAANGIIGLETALGLTLRLVHQKKLTLRRAIELLSTSPAAIVGLPAGALAPGRPADVTVFNPDEEFDYTAARVQSKSRNTPFLGWRLPGVIRYTIVDGKIAYQG